MNEMADRHRRAENLPEILHLKTRRIGVEMHTDRMLHPGVGNQYP